MKTIIIPDVHENIEAVKRILATGYDRAVFLGDWFDRFPTQPGDLHATIEWLRQNVESLDFEFLYGNHDLPYVFDVEQLGCTGHQYHFRHDICSVMKSRAVMENFGLTIEVEGWRLSHAGFTKHMAYGDLDRRCELALESLRAGYHPVLVDSEGCTWVRWSNFVSVPGLKQIVGHTKDSEVRWKGDNICLDTRLRHFAVIEDGTLTVHETPKAA